MVFEIDQQERVLHLKSLESPESSSTPDTSNNTQPQESIASVSQPQATPSAEPLRPPEVSEDTPAPTQVQEGYLWSEDFTAVLGKFLSPPVLDRLKQMYEEGPEPPFASDSGWGGRQARQEESGIIEETPVETTPKGGRGRGRRGRGGRGKDRGGRAERRDDRRVITEVRIVSLQLYVAKGGT